MESTNGNLRRAEKRVNIQTKDIETYNSSTLGTVLLTGIDGSTYLKLSTGFRHSFISANDTEKKKRRPVFFWCEAFVLSFMILEMATSFSDGSSVRIHFLFPPTSKKRTRESNCIIFRGQPCSPWEF